jgi:hypothetical protein
MLAAFTLLGCSMMVVLAQSVSIVRNGNAVAVRAPSFDFIKGEPLDRLRDGRSVRVDLELDVLPGPGGSAAARGRQTYVLSYDLWEERFAVTLPGDLKRSAAYLTSSAAEDWCLEQLTVPVSALGQLGRELPFWVRLGYRVQDPDASGDSGTDYSIRGLIDALSRRRKSAPQSLSIEAGPFRLPQ